jgi:hypothetical protein
MMLLLSGSIAIAKTGPTDVVVVVQTPKPSCAFRESENREISINRE